MKGIIQMAKYEQYTVKSGVKWHVRGYLGTDEATGKQEEYNKRGFKTKKEAQAAYARAKNDFYDGTYDKTPVKSITFNQVYQEWFDQYKLDVKESTAYKTNHNIELYILPTLGKYKINKITTNTLQKLVNSLNKRIVNYRHVYNYATNIIKYAYDHDYIKVNVSEKVRIPKKKKTTEVKTEKVVYNKKKMLIKEGNFYTRSELQTLLKLFDTDDTQQWYTFFRLLGFTGMRKGEASALTWKDINFKDKVINIDKTLVLVDKGKHAFQAPKTNASTRVISVDDRTLEVLKRWKHAQAEYLIGFGFNALNPKQLVFCQLTKNRHLGINDPLNKLYQVCTLNEFPATTVHGFRHTHASLLFEAGVPMKDVKNRLGHTNIQTTMDVYTHVTEESKNNSAELFAKYADF